MVKVPGVVGKWSKHLLLGLMGAGLAICLSSTPANAQGKMQVFGGYSFGTDSFAFDCELGCNPGLQGYAASFAYNFTPHVGMEAAFTGHNGSFNAESEQPTATDNGFSYPAKQDLYVYTFGPRLTLPAGDFSLFTHFLVGATHRNESITEDCLPATGTPTFPCAPAEDIRFSGNGFAFKTGGGVDWNHHAWGIRILEVDYVHSQVPATITGTAAGAPVLGETLTISANSFELATGVTFNLGGSAR